MKYAAGDATIWVEKFQPSILLLFAWSGHLATVRICT